MSWPHRRAVATAAFVGVLLGVGFGLYSRFHHPSVGMAGGVGANPSLVAVGCPEGGGGWITLYRGGEASPFARTRVPWDAYDQEVGSARPLPLHLSDAPGQEIVVALGPRGDEPGGWIVVLDAPERGCHPLAWRHIVLGHSRRPQTLWIAGGDVDGDGRDEIVVGGTDAAGEALVLADLTHDLAPVATLRVPWSAYDKACGETRPAVGDLDGDGKAEVVLGLGGRGVGGSAAGGWLPVFKDMRLAKWVRFPSMEHDAKGGGTWPAIGDVRGEGKGQLLLGTDSAAGAPLAVLSDPLGEARSGWIPVPQEVTSRYSEVRPLCADLDGSGGRQIVLSFPERGEASEVALLDDASGQHAFLGWREGLLPAGEVATNGSAPAPDGSALPVVGDRVLHGGSRMKPLLSLDVQAGGRVVARPSPNVISTAILPNGGQVVALANQGGAQGVIQVPDSSVEKASDLGQRSHTNHAILLSPALGLGPGGGMSPAQVRAFYGVPANGGQGVIAIVDAYHYPSALADFNTFSARFGLPQETSGDVMSASNHVLQVVFQGGTQPSVDFGWNGEEALDIEWAHAMAPNAKIVLVEAQTNGFNDLFAAIDLAVSLPAVKQVSNSWGGAEFAGETDFDSHFNVNGPLIFVSAGDNGAPAEYPSASPYVVSVGGTHVATDGSGLFTGETAWSLSGGWGTGGGPSSQESKPSWQNGVTNTPSTRGTPDISADADPSTGGAVFGPADDGSGSVWQVIGGTSLASPLMAGMVNASGGSYANTTALLTRIYSRVLTADVRDITTGNNGHPCLTGYDLCTGVGTPQGTLFPSAVVSNPVVTSPAPGSTFTSSSVTLSWSAGSGVTGYWLYLGSARGGSDLLSYNAGTQTSYTANNLPTDGRALYFRFWYLRSGAWLYTDYTYTASTAAVVNPQLLSPPNASQLASSSATFTWSAGTGVSAYWVYLGSSVGGYDLLNYNAGSSLSVTANGLPTDGRALYLRLWYLGSGAWRSSDYTFTASSGGGALPAITSPLPGTVLSSSSVTLSWTPGSGVTQFWLSIGSSRGAADLLGQNEGTALSVTVNGLPTNGITLYVRFWYLVGGVWNYTDYTYTAS